MHAVVLAVVNSGEIPSGAFARLFEPFWQGAEATRARGLGLGLWIVQQIVTAHGGEIAVRSEHNKTTFSVRMPR